MTSTTRRRVCSLTLGLPFRTRDTVPTLTPAVAATSAMFTRWADLSRLTPRLRWQAEQLLRMEPLPLHVLLVAAASQATGSIQLGHMGLRVDPGILGSGLAGPRAVSPGDLSRRG